MHSIIIDVVESGRCIISLNSRPRWRSTIEWSHMSVMARKLLVTRLFVNSLLRLTKKATLHITGLFCYMYEGNPAVTNGFPQQRTSIVIKFVACCGRLSLLKLMSVYWEITVQRYNQTPTWGFAMQNFNTLIWWKLLTFIPKKSKSMLLSQPHHVLWRRLPSNF